MSNSDSPVVLAESDDPAMQAASEMARKTFRYFWRELSWENRRIIPGLSLAAIKGYFTDPTTDSSDSPDGLQGEHMWLVDVDFDGKRIQGTLINSPNSLESYSEGDRCTLSGKQLSDWMYVQMDVVCGGFTIDVLRSQMSKNERSQHDKAWGIDFGEVGIVDLVPPKDLGDPPRKKGFLASLFGGGKQTPQDYAKAAAAEHPMSVNMRESLDEQLKQAPDFLSETDDNGFTLFHQLCLAGSLDGVEVCLAHGANVDQPAGNGMSPYKLATCLGWKRVMKRLEQAGAMI